MKVTTKETKVYVVELTEAEALALRHADTFSEDNAADLSPREVQDQMAGRIALTDLDQALEAAGHEYFTVMENQ